jgi:hypothetical protein
MPTIIPFYCNPFFHRCKQNFRKIQKFFYRKADYSEKTGHCHPKTGKNRPEDPSCRGFPGDEAQDQSGRVPDPQVSSCDPESQY